MNFKILGGQLESAPEAVENFALFPRPTTNKKIFFNKVILFKDFDI